MGFLGVDGGPSLCGPASQLFGKKQFLGSFEDEEEVWTTQTSCFVGDPLLCVENISTKTTNKNIQGDVFFLIFLKKRYRFFFVLKVDFRDSENGSFSERPDRNSRLEAS